MKRTESVSATKKGPVRKGKKNAEEWDMQAKREEGLGEFVEMGMAVTVGGDVSMGTGTGYGF